MSDDLKAKSNEQLVADYGQLAATAPWHPLERETIAALEAELLRRMEAGEKAEAALKLAETTREAWRKEAEALEQEVEGLRAERDQYRVANEALRARVANHIAAFEAIARVGCYEAPQSSCHRHGSDPEEFCAACLAALMLSDRDGEQLASELDRLRERVAELEDAERIAWCLTVGISQRDQHEGDATWLVPVYGVWRLVMRRDGRQKGTQRVVLNEGDYPILTPQARALIDAAREQAEEGGTE